MARQSGLVLTGQQLIVVKAFMEASSVKAAQHLKIFYFDADYEGGLHDQVRQTFTGPFLNRVRKPSVLLGLLCLSVS